MNEAEIIKKLEAEGFDTVWVYEAEPGEVDEEHQHDYDTRLVILRGQIRITAPVPGVGIENLSHQVGSHVDIARNTPHAAKVGPEGCRYIVAEKR